MRLELHPTYKLCPFDPCTTGWWRAVSQLGTAGEYVAEPFEVQLREKFERRRRQLFRCIRKKGEEAINLLLMEQGKNFCRLTT